MLLLVFFFFFKETPEARQARLQHNAAAHQSSRASGKLIYTSLAGHVSFFFAETPDTR